MFKKIWDYFSGKKRTIALVYWSVVVPSLMVIWPDGFHTQTAVITYKVCTIFGFVLSAVGLGHAAVKTWMPGSTEIQNDEQIAKEESEAQTAAPKTEIVVEAKPQETADATTEVKKDS